MWLSQAVKGDAFFDALFGCSSIAFGGVAEDGDAAAGSGGSAGVAGTPGCAGSKPERTGSTGGDCECKLLLGCVFS